MDRAQAQKEPSPQAERPFAAPSADATLQQNPHPESLPAVASPQAYSPPPRDFGPPDPAPPLPQLRGGTEGVVKPMAQDIAEAALPDPFPARSQEAGPNSFAAMDSPLGLSEGCLPAYLHFLLCYAFGLARCGVVWCEFNATV